ncbi:FIST signal transduction protein [Thiocystis violacea]|uniref:FIST signal transduction protein n=1 Tax=Thiocystis violacea TaxID=13725 RepID=UPI001905D4C7|nr:FIST C-terminal domain-containing protein [Thiocystis violacea]MBK1718162.1 hypothetical protein [Thiocystis violacea]
MNEETFHLLETLGEDGLLPVLSVWRDRYPRGAIIALVAESERSRLPLLQAACRAHGLVLLGALFPGLIRQERFVTQGACLLVLPGVPRHALIDRLDADGPGSAARIAAALPQDLDAEAPPTLFMIFDAMVPNIASILDDLYLELADGVRYLGANAGSETFQPMPCLFDGERLIGDGVLCLLLPGDWNTGLIHGYRAPDDLVTATATAGNKIVGIDWRPAFPVYRDKVLERYGVALDRENFYRYAVHFPFGIELANGQTLVRIPVALDADDGILCVGEVPNNALLTLLQSPEVDSLDTARSLAERLRLEPPAYPWLLFFYCAGRRLHLGEAAERELTACAREIGADPIGALTLGEIGSLGEGAYPLFHNAAVLGIRWKAPGDKPA